VGHRFELGEFLLKRCGRQVEVASDFVGKMWVTGSNWEGFGWRDAGDRFEFEVYSLERCGRQVQVGRVFVG
jgi:hypothetical protein